MTMDTSLFQALNDYTFSHSVLSDLARFIAEDAQFLFVGLLAVLFFATGGWRSVNGRHGVVAAGLSALIGLGVAQLIGHLWDRPRPYEALDSAHLLLSASPDPSFPSDHAVAAFAIAVSILLRHRSAGLLALAAAVLLCVARVAAGAHYPGDVLGGAIIGTASALLLWHPSIRSRLNALADAAGSLYERILGFVLGRRVKTG